MCVEIITPGKKCDLIRTEMERVQELDPHKDKKGSRLRLVDLQGQSGKGPLRQQPWKELSKHKEHSAVGKS